MSEIDIQNLPEPSNSYYTGPKSIPIEVIIDLKERKLSNSQIGKILNCHPSNVSRRLKELEITNKYVRNKGLLLDHLERKIYDQITDAKLKKANLNQTVWSFGVIYDKNRLQHGESTQNIAYADVIKARDQAKLTLDEVREIHKQRHSNVTDVIDITNNSVDSGLHNDI